MADYPAQRQKHGSTKEVSYGTQLDRMESGKSRFRTFYSQKWLVFRLIHECSTAEKDALLSHYATHATSSFSMTFQGDGAAYTVRYASKPQDKLLVSPQDWEVQTVLITV